MKTLRKIYFRIFKRYRRLEGRFLSYGEADKLICSCANKPEGEQWRIAPEDDRNTVFGYVHLERRERITQ